MAGQQLAKKLQIKPGQRLLVLNAPPGYEENLEPIPEGCTMSTTPGGVFDFVQFFAKNSEELAHFAPVALQAVKPDGLLWVAYPKGSSGIETDLSRDEGWAALTSAGFRPIRQIAIDATWSALRFRPSGSDQDLIEQQYAGAKAGLRPIYERLVELAQGLGRDVQLGPRKTYVSLNRGKQFALIKASTRARVDLGLRLPQKTPTERLQPAGNFGSGSVTHKVGITTLDDIDEELMAWLKAAYESVG